MVSANHTTQVTAWAELAIRRINDYLNANKLKLNPDKTKIITFTKGNQPKVSLVAGGEHIESKTHTKLLGNYIHESLTWKKNSGILLGQPTDRLQSLRIMRKHTSFKVIKQIANGIIMGKINFAIQLWSGMPDGSAYSYILYIRIVDYSYILYIQITLCLHILYTKCLFVYTIDTQALSASY